MPIIALQGLRGGCGATSISAALGWALNALQQTVLVIDFSPVNQLAAHFNLPINTAQGWVPALLNQQSWQQSAHLSAADTDFSAPLLHALPALKSHYDWIILDIPADLLPWQRSLLATADRLLQVLTLDANCQLRLHHTRFAPPTLFLINQFNANSQLQQDLHQLWISSLKNLIPLVIHRDEALAEALMMKQPVGEYRPHALASEEINTLANWLLLNVAGGAA
jgi:cellulose biosynthesis protein BcsQ